MRTANLLITSLLFSCLIHAQTFTETCPSSTTNGTVVNFAEYDGTIYATGFFSQICGQSAQFLGEWDGTEWVPGLIAITDPGHSLKVINDKMYIARYEESIDSNWLYSYDGSTLEKVSPGIYLTTASGFSELPNIYDVEEYQGDIYMCGEFDRLGADPYNAIARWDGTNWTDVGGGLTGSIVGTAPVLFPHQLLTFGSDLYVCGNFRYAGGVEVNGIARWDGTNWNAVGAGFNGTVYGIGVYDGALYAGGSFTSSGTETLRRLARWDGTSWLSPGFGFINATPADFSFVHTIKEIDGEMYLGGGLKRVLYDDGSEEDCGGIVKWDGDSLDNFMGGITGNDIEAIIQDSLGNILIGGGVFGSGYVGILEAPLDTTSTGLVTIENVNLELWPNPFTDQLFIAHNSSFKSVSVVDLSGKVIEQYFNIAPSHGSKEKLLLDLSYLPVGMYFLKLETESTSLSRLITKQN